LQKTVVIDDLISTGKSSLQVVDVLRSAGVEIIGMVSIFNYGFEVLIRRLQKELSLYFAHQLYCADKPCFGKRIVAPEMEQVLLQWRNDPENWKPRPLKESDDNTEDYQAYIFLLPGCANDQHSNNNEKFLSHIIRCFYIALLLFFKSSN